MPSLRVAIDATPLLGNVTGIGVATRGLIHALVQRSELDLSAFALSRNAGALRQVVPRNVAICSRTWPAEVVLRMWQVGDLPDARWWTGDVDVVHGTNYVVPPSRKAACVVTVNDLFSLHHPEQVSAASRRYPRLIRRAVERGAWVHVPSHTVADAVMDWLPAVKERLVVAHHGVAVERNAEFLGQEISGAQRYVIFLGTIEPRKGLPSLIKAWDAVHSKLPEMCLVIAGTPAWGQQALNEAIAGSTVAGSITVLGRVDDSQRTALVRDAEVLCMPSVDEGFGFPVLEAMALGTAVVSSDGGSLPEIVGDAGVVVPVGDVEAFAEALLGVLDDEAERKRLVALGLARVEEFTWDKAADEMIALYSRAAAGKD